MSDQQHITEGLERRARRLQIGGRIGQVVFWSCVVALLLWMAPFVPLGLSWEEYQIPAATETVLLGIATLVSGVIGRLQLVAAARVRTALMTWRAYHDDLTGLPNRRYFHHYMDEHASLHEEKPLSLILLDVDSLKGINDHYGHVAGDMVLRQIATTLEQHIRPQDLLIRMWGDEFLVVTPLTDAITAALLAQRLCSYVAAESQNVDSSVGTTVVATVSSGVATYEGNEDVAPEDLIRLADFRLHIAKNMSRSDVATAALAENGGPPRGLLTASASALLSQLGPLLTSEAPLAEKFTRVSENIALATGYDVVYVDVLHWGQDGLDRRDIFFSGTELLESWQQARRPPERAKIMQEVARTQRPVILHHPANDPRLSPRQRKLVERAGVESAAAVPLLYEGQLLGMLVTASRRHDAFSQKDINVLHTIATQLGPVLKNAMLLEQVRDAASSLESAYRSTVTLLANVAEARDPYTSNHLQRISAYCEALAREVGMSPEEAEEIGLASVLHDLGKVRLPDQVLAKTGPLSEKEQELIRMHPQFGEEILGTSPLFKTAREVARWHHERWDGGGYPDGLAGTQIPLSARIVAVADSFDALSSSRPYKDAWSFERAAQEIIAHSGDMFCPSVVQAFERLYRSGELRKLAAVSDRESSARLRKAAA